MKSSILAAILTAALFLVPIAHAQSGTVPIGNPETDTLQLWESIASAIEVAAQDAMSEAGQVTSALQHLASTSSKTKAPAATSSHQSASLAAAVSSLEGASSAPAASSETALNSTSAQRTISTSVSSAPNQPPTNQPSVSQPASPSRTVDATAYVTQPELSAQLLQLSNSFDSKVNSAQFLTVPAWGAIASYRSAR